MFNTGTAKAWKNGATMKFRWTNPYPKKLLKNDWPEVYKEVKSAVVEDNFVENVQQLYTEKPCEKIQRRMSDQVQKLIQRMEEYIESDELWTLVVPIKEKKGEIQCDRPPNIP